jgi:hypothetical protein
MKGGIGNLMKQAQKMQQDMARAQEEVAAMEVTGEAGGGLVTITMTGRHGRRHQDQVRRTCPRHGPAAWLEVAVLDSHQQISRPAI